MHADQHGDEYERLGDAFLSAGNYQMALLQYENSLKKNNGDIGIRYKKGIALMRAGNLQDAQKQFLSITEKDDYALAYEGLGRISLKEKQFHMAKTYFEKAVSLDPLLWRTYGYLGDIATFAKDYPTSVTHYRTSLTINPGSGYILNNLGYSLFVLKQYEASIDAYYKAIELNYDSSKVYNNLGTVFLKMERYDRAFEVFLKSGSKAVAYNNLGVGYLTAGNIDEAEKCFQKAIELSPHFYLLAHENLQKCQLMKKMTFK